jgi:hypothetical protein
MEHISSSSEEELFSSSSEEEDEEEGLYYTGFNKNQGDYIKVITYVKNKDLSDDENCIAEQSRYIDYKPYSHNIVGMRLGIIAEREGNDAANAMIMKYGLNKKGWNEVHFK